MNRTLLTLTALLIAGTATAEPSGDPFEGKMRAIAPDRTLTQQEVVRAALPHLPRVAACYRRHALPSPRANGMLEIYVVISGAGKIVHSEVNAPRVLPRRLWRLTNCLRNEMARWRFPQRKGFTNATIPYFFLNTRHPTSRPRATTVAAT